MVVLYQNYSRNKITATAWNLFEADGTKEQKISLLNLENKMKYVFQAAINNFVFAFSMLPSL